MTPLPEPEQCYRAVQSRDARFDGWFVTGVTSTGIYCRPSCPAVAPKRANVRFYPTAAAAQLAGFRACLRCRPDAAPGSPEWNSRADLVGRAMRLIGDGVIEREGVAGLSRRLGYSERHLHRQLAAELGAGPLSLARARRAQTARVLLETTALPIADVAFAAGFASVRQFNDTIREVFATTPTRLRTLRGGGGAPAPGTVTLRLPYREPFAADALTGFLAARAVAGIEEWDGSTYRRTLALPHGAATVALAPAGGHVACTLRLGDLRDLGAAVARCRRLLDLDADPVAVDAALSSDDVLRDLVAETPGIRLPGAVDGFELAVRGVVGQQVSVAAACTVLGRIVAATGTPLSDVDGALTHTFPAPGLLAEADDAALPMPAARRRTVRALAAAVADGSVPLDPGVSRGELTASLCALPGIGPWTASYVAMRALSDPDAFLPTDLGIRAAAARLGLSPDLDDRSSHWRPWRSYAAVHLWHTLAPVSERS
ncbi:MAG TPA: AlkA N-terminal domain-containing protein [Mycobacteriales bacterium]|nr:AlkA N-terminal domain-containing protein [Mycobacteriales bacterium]